MTRPNKFTRAQEKAIRDVGREIEIARSARRLSLRGAAERTRTRSRTGRVSEFTWRRVEMGFTPAVIGGVRYEKLYRPTAETLTAMCEVVGLDGDAMCLKIGLEPIPEYKRPKPIDELTALRQQAAELFERIQQIEQSLQPPESEEP